MKRLLTGVVFGVILAGTSAGQARPGEIRAAVIEFSPAANVSPMTHEAKRHLQASIAFALEKSHKFSIVDVRHTRNASQSILAAVNDDKSTAAAVKVGKQLGVSYVLTGTVADYDPKGGEGFGYARLRARLVEVATGDVKYSGEIAQKGTNPMSTTGAAEMQTRVLMPAIGRLAEALCEKF